MQKPLIYLNLSHNDLDGIFAAIAIRAAHADKSTHVKTVFVDYGNIDKELCKAIAEDKRYKKIIISDITFTPKQKQYSSNTHKKMAEDILPDLIKSYVESGGEIIVLDHHERVDLIKTQYNNYLSDKSILEIKDENGISRAGSELAARYYKREIKYASKLDNILSKYCEIAGDYDTWRNPHGIGGLLSMAVQKMNDPYQCLYEFEKSISLICRDSFRDIEFYDEKSYIEKLSSSILGQYVQHIKEDYKKRLEESLRTLITLEFEPIVINEVYAPNYGSVISDHIYKKTNGIVIVKYDLNKGKNKRISLRCDKDREDINLAKFAGKYGGGGHASAAGMNTGDKSIKEIARELLCFYEKALHRRA